MSIKEWSRKNAHFQALAKQNVQITLGKQQKFDSFQRSKSDFVKNRIIQEDVGVLMENAINSWTKRCCPYWKETDLRIDDAVEVTLRYLLNVMTWFDNMIKSFSPTGYGLNLCPFQLDLSMVFDEAMDTSMDFEMEYDSDVSDFEQDGASIPFPNDILARLRANQLLYYNMKLQPQDLNTNVHSYNIFKEFLSKNGCDEIDGNRNWLFQKRLMMIVDRRGNTPSDNLWFVVFHGACNMTLCQLLSPVNVLNI